MLKKLLEVIVKAAAKIGQKQVAKLNNNLLVRLLPVQINASEEVLRALLDDDKDNDAQLVEVLKRNFTITLSEGAELANEALLKLENKDLAFALQSYVAGTREILTALLDDDKDNEAQLKAIWHKRKEHLIGSGVDIVTDIFKKVIDKKVADPEIRAILIAIIEGLDDFVRTPEAPALAA